MDSIAAGNANYDAILNCRHRARLEAQSSAVQIDMIVFGCIAVISIEIGDRVEAVATLAIIENIAAAGADKGVRSRTTSENVVEFVSRTGMRRAADECQVLDV